MKGETLWNKFALALGGLGIVSKKWTDQCEDCSLKKERTSRERPKSAASYLRVKNIQGTTIGEIWKKNIDSKNVFGKKSRILPKNPKKDPLGLLNVF